MHHCPHCDYASPVQSRVSRHVKARHVEETSEPHRCPEPGCDGVFKSNMLLKSHIRRIHQMGDTQACSECSQGRYIGREERMNLILSVAGLVFLVMDQLMFLGLLMIVDLLMIDDG